MHPYLEEPYTTEERKRIIGQRLQEIRTKYRLKQTEVSNIIGVTAQTYSGYEKGRYEPSAETLIRLAYLYRTTTDFLTAKNRAPKSQNRENENEGKDYAETFDEEKMQSVNEEIELMQIQLDQLKQRIKDTQK